MGHHFLLRLEEPNAQNRHLPSPQNEIAAIMQFALGDEQNHSWLMTIGNNGAGFDLAGNSMALVTSRPADGNIVYLMVGKIMHEPVANLPAILNGSDLGTLYQIASAGAMAGEQPYVFWELEKPVCLTHAEGNFASYLPPAAQAGPGIGVNFVPGSSQAGGIAFPALMGQQHFFFWNLGGGAIEYGLTQEWLQLSNNEYPPL